VFLNKENLNGKQMDNLITLLIIIGYVVVMRFVLPRFGVNT
jgi:hypothetical protein